MYVEDSMGHVHYVGLYLLQILGGLPSLGDELVARQRASARNV